MRGRSETAERRALRKQPLTAESLVNARTILGLGDSTTLADLKKRYRELVKKHHPDGQSESRQAGFHEVMTEINAAYELVLRYCETYRIPLTQDSDTLRTGEDDFWSRHFGEGDLWPEN